MVRKTISSEELRIFGRTIGTPAHHGAKQNNFPAFARSPRFVGGLNWVTIAWFARIFWPKYANFVALKWVVSLAFGKVTFCVSFFCGVKSSNPMIVREIIFCRSSWSGGQSSGPSVDILRECCCFGVSVKILLGCCCIGVSLVVPSAWWRVCGVNM